MGEGTIPWWVWLLAALLGLLLLALIVLCLYKVNIELACVISRDYPRISFNVFFFQCGFFKRKRPENSPEREPLNGYH